jgi:hypothetical protein
VPFPVCSKLTGSLPVSFLSAYLAWERCFLRFTKIRAASETEETAIAITA